MDVITALNGRLPATMLVVADTGPNGPQSLRIDAAASWRRMLAAGMPARCLRSGYRTLAQQASQDPALALPAGQSQHGEGIAADIDEPGRSWVTRWGRPYGWRIGFVPGEPWHAQYDQPDQHLTTEDDVSAADVWNQIIDDPNDQLPPAPAFALLTGARQDAGAALAAANAALDAVRGVWDVQIQRGSVGPAAARDFLGDTRILAETAATRPLGTGAALSDADVQRITDAVAGAVRTALSGLTLKAL